MELYNRLVILKKKNKMTTEVLSDLSGVPRGTLNKILNGETKNPTSETIRKLAEAMRCPMEVLMNDEKFQLWDSMQARRIPDEEVERSKRKCRSKKEALDQIPGVYRASQGAKQRVDYVDIVKIRKELVPEIGEIAAGRPMDCVEESDEYVLNIMGVPCDFAVRVHGDSMVGARILDGDVVYIRKQDDVPDGAIAAVCVNNSATLKRVYHIPNGLRLVSENVKYPPMTFKYPESESIQILGLAVGFGSAIR